MAKSPSPAKPSTVTIGGAVLSVVEWGEAPAAIQRKIGAETSPYSGLMAGMQAPADGRYAQFFVPAGTPPATITDASEAAKWKAEDVRKVTNRISSIARRLSKRDASIAFSVRTVTRDNTLGVMVYRVEPTANAPAPAPTPAAPTPA